MKRILKAFILALVIAAMSVTAYAKSGISTYSEKLQLLISLGAMHADEDLTEGTKITRARFAKELAGFMNLPVSSNDEATYFYDVSVDNKYLVYINTLKEQNVMVGSDGYFRPDDYVTNMEVAKCVVSALGYSTIAERKGYKQGYTEYASSLKLTTKLKGTLEDDATVEDMVSIFFNALEAPVMECEIKDGRPNYVIKSDVDFLEKAYNVYSDKGIIDANEYTDLEKNGPVAENNVRMNGTAYELSEDCVGVKFYLGYKTEIYYREKDGERTIIMALPVNAKETVVSDDEYDSYANSKIKYYDNETGKLVTAKISADANIIYNDSVVTSYDKSIFDIKRGSIELVSRDGGSVYDLVKIYSYKNYTVASVLKDKKTIMFKNTANKLDLNEYDNVYIRNKTGSGLTLDDISEWSVLSVGSSFDGKILYITVSNDTANGTISSTNKKTPSVTMNGEEYKISADYSENCDEALTVGKNVTLYLDYKGEVAYASGVVNTGDWQYGYLMNAWVEREKCSVQIYTAGDEKKEFELPKKIKFDGASILSTKAYLELCTANDSYVEPQLIKYKQKADGTISAIDTKRVNIANGEDESTSLTEDVTKTTMRMNWGTKRFYSCHTAYGYTTYFTNVRADAKSILFIVPSDISEQRSDETQYSVYTGTTYFDQRASGNEAMGNLSVYDIDEKNGDLAPAFVITGGASEDYSGLMVVSEKTLGLTPDDEATVVLKGYLLDSGAESTYTLEASVKTFNHTYNTSVNDGTKPTETMITSPIEDLHEGDVISVIQNNSGMVKKVKRIFGTDHLTTTVNKYNDDGTITEVTEEGTFIPKHGVINSTGTDMGYPGGANQVYMVGVITDKNGKYIRFQSTNPLTGENVGEKGRAGFDLSAAKGIFRYDTVKKQLDKLTVDEVEEYVHSVNEDAYMFEYSRNTGMYGMVIYE